jgi:predicted bacteriocin transport accessory protein
MMKKSFILIICFLLLLGCTSSTKKEKVTGIKEIQYKALKKKMSQNVEFILYIGRPDCGDCMAFKPILEEYLAKNKNAGLYYLNTKAYRDAAKKKDGTKEEKDFYDNLYKTFEIDWTPTLEVISNGKIVKQYKYLDEAYYEIKDRAKQIEKQKEFVKKFKTFMDDYFKEDAS